MYVVGSLLRFVTDHEERLKVMDDIIRPFIQEFKRLLDEKDSVSKWRPIFSAFGNPDVQPRGSPTLGVL